MLTQRSGLKDQDNSLFTQRQPGPLADLLGARVEQWYALEDPVPVEGQWGTTKSPMWAEQLGVTAKDTETLMRYGKSNGWLDNQPAAVTRRVGKGRITYIGTALETAAMTTAAKWMLSSSGLTPVMPGLPEGIDLAIRSSNGKQIYILTNYNAAPQTVTLPKSMTDVLTGTSSSTITLQQYAVAVLQ